MCEKCKHWKIQDEFLRVGYCAIFNKKTEWCAGIIRTLKKEKICKGFSQIPLDKPK